MPSNTEWFGGPLPATILARATDWYECLCGNDPTDFGFYPCTKDGTRIDQDSDLNEDISALWDAQHLLCDRCGLILDQDTFNAATHTVNVVGRRAE
jgi:hypothetical protein